MTIKTKLELEQFITSRWEDINSYIDKMMSPLRKQRCLLPFYNSVDIRESHSKFAPVDNNLYPAGFNNICMLDLNVCVSKIKKAIHQLSENYTDVGLIPESNTKNLFYLDHLFTLKMCLEKAGYNVVVMSFDKSLFNEGSTSLNLQSHSGHEIEIHHCEVQDHKVYCNNQTYDLVILNHDQSKAIDISWEELKTIICPTPLLGWNRREKAKHFQFYHQVADEFCHHFDIDPSLIQADFALVNDVDFETKAGLEQLAQAVDKLKDSLSGDQKVFVKANKGTYGMGIQVVDSGDAIRSMNRKTRNKMNVGKNNLKFQSVLIQEGVNTILSCDGHPAEVTIYLISGMSVGGFLRTNPQKDALSNLNSRGMIYQKYCISEIQQGHDHQAKEAIYSVIARLSSLACAYEIKEIYKKDKKVCGDIFL